MNKQALFNAMRKAGVPPKEARKRADEAMSQWGKDMRARVKTNPNAFNSEKAREAAKRRWSKEK